MNYISLDNLTRYHSKFKDYADAKYTLARDYGWKQTEKAGAVTCWPVGESRMKPVVEFMFKETLPEGTKGPGNPSTIEGVSSVALLRTGKNLLSSRDGTKTVNTIQFTENPDGSITVNGANSSSTASAYYHVIKTVNGSLWKKVGITYTLSGCPSGGSSSSYYITAFGNSGLTDFGNGSTRTLTIANNASVAIAITPSASVSNLVFKPQLELGSIATEYEPYSGTNYTIAFPSTFYGGSLDVASGRLTVTHRMIEADSLILDISNYPAYLPLECTDTFGRTITSTGNILALTGSTGGKIVYKLANPYTVQIDPVVITSLPQIDKYTPRLNTLYTDAENITVKYIKSPIRDEYEKVQAIIANGGTI